MWEELSDESTSINAIYGDGTLVSLSGEGESQPSEAIYALTLPSTPWTSVRIAFPSTYPASSPPSILGSHTVDPDAPIGAAADLVDLLRAILEEVYTSGAPCIFDLVEEAGARLEHEHQITKASEQTADDLDGDDNERTGRNEPHSRSGENIEPIEEDGDRPQWTESDAVTVKKSVFLARAAKIENAAQASKYVRHFVTTDRRARQATHNICAWRVRSPDGARVEAEYDDDGESAAGGRLLRLLELMNVMDLVVVVSRWYGGVLLGPDRFRIINQTAREAVVRAGFLVEAEERAKRGKKKEKK